MTDVSVRDVYVFEAGARDALLQLRASVERMPDDPLAWCPDCTGPSEGMRRCIDDRAVTAAIDALLGDES